VLLKLPADNEPEISGGNQAKMKNLPALVPSG